MLYLPVGSSSLETVEWVIVFSWIALGVIIYIVNLRHKNSLKDEREKAIYGNDDNN